jgi:hypothetical protein
MRIRLTGTREQTGLWVDEFRRTFDVQHVGAFTPWTRRDDQSKIGAVYIDAELRPEKPIQATARRLDQHTPVPQPRNRRQLP